MIKYTTLIQTISNFDRDGKLVNSKTDTTQYKCDKFDKIRIRTLVSGIKK